MIDRCGQRRVPSLNGHLCDSRCFYGFPLIHPRIQKRTSGGESLLPPMFLVRARFLQLNLRIWEMKDWVQLLEDPHGSTHTPLGEDQTRLTMRYTRQYNLGFY